MAGGPRLTAKYNAGLFFNIDRKKLGTDGTFTNFHPSKNRGTFRLSPVSLVIDKIVLVSCVSA
jgi:hypothetical protein